MRRTKLCRSLAVALAAVGVTSIARAQEPVKPGPEHAHLKKLEGVWDTTMKMGPMESKGTATYRMDLGGLWLLSQFEGDIAGQKFSGFANVPGAPNDFTTTAARAQPVFICMTGAGTLNRPQI